MAYKFIDGVARKDIEKVINVESSNGWEFKSFLQHKDEYDNQIGILFTQ